MNFPIKSPANVKCPRVLRNMAVCKLCHPAYCAVCPCLVKVHAAESANCCNCAGDVELYKKIKNCIMIHVTEEPVGFATTHTVADTPVMLSFFC